MSNKEISDKNETNHQYLLNKTITFENVKYKINEIKSENKNNDWSVYLYCDETDHNGKNIQPHIIPLNNLINSKNKGLIILKIHELEYNEADCLILHDLVSKLIDLFPKDIYPNENSRLHQLFDHQNMWNNKNDNTGEKQFNEIIEFVKNDLNKYI